MTDPGAPLGDLFDLLVDEVDRRQRAELDRDQLRRELVQLRDELRRVTSERDRLRGQVRHGIPHA